MADPMLAAVASDVTELRRNLAVLTAGLSALADGQAATVELLKALLSATTPGDAEGGLADVLGQIARALEEQSGTLAVIRDAVRPGANR